MPDKYQSLASYHSNCIIFISFSLFRIQKLITVWISSAYSLWFGFNWNVYFLKWSTNWRAFQKWFDFLHHYGILVFFLNLYVQKYTFWHIRFANLRIECLTWDKIPLNFSIDLFLQMFVHFMCISHVTNCFCFILFLGVV